MERPHLFTLGDNNNIAKVHSRNLKIFFFSVTAFESPTSINVPKSFHFYFHYTSIFQELMKINFWEILLNDNIR